MKVLLIAHAYPPAPASGAQRAGNVADALSAAGADVRVITVRAPAGDEVRRPDRDVVEVGMLPSGADLLSAIVRPLAEARRIARSGPPARRRTPPTGAGHGVGVDVDPMDPGPRLRRWVTAAMRFPDGQIGFLAPALRAAVKAGGWADVVYTTGPPVTTHLTGLGLHALRGTPWVAEYRDPWIVDGAPYRSPSLRARPTDAIERALAQQCHAAAAEVVAVSVGIARVIDPLRSRVGRPSSHVVLNGIPSLSPAPPRRDRSGPLKILHLGNLYAFRDPRPFLDALAAVRAERAWRPDDIRVDFVGDAPPASVRAHVDAVGLGDIVHFVEWVPHETGQVLIRDADLLLLLAQRQPLQIPNKLYEYLGSRNPILAFADARGETARMLERVAGHGLVSESDDPRRARGVLAELLAAGRRGGASERGADSGDDDTLRGWTTKRQLAALPEILERACVARGPGPTQP